MTPPKNLGMLLLAVWLILFGVLTAPFLRFSFAYSTDILAVLAVVTHLAGPGLLTRILHQLPDGYALLFGQAELRRPQAAAA